MKSFENGKFTLGVFIELSKVLHTVNHYILVKHYRVSGIYFNRFKSYFMQRKQCIFNNDKIIWLCRNLIWCISGSILGPLLFLIYIKICNPSLYINLIMFADDTNLFTPSSSSVFYIKLKNIQSTNYKRYKRKHTKLDSSPYFYIKFKKVEVR